MAKGKPRSALSARARLVRDTRERLGWSQKKLSKYLRVSVASVNAWENDRTAEIPGPLIHCLQSINGALNAVSMICSPGVVFTIQRIGVSGDLEVIELTPSEFIFENGAGGLFQHLSNIMLTVPVGSWGKK